MRIRLGCVQPGREVLLYNKPCVVLEHRAYGTFLLSCEEITRKFGKTNCFYESELMDYLNGRYLNQLTKDHPEEVLEHIVNLVARDGSNNYGAICCKVAPLSLHDFSRFSNAIPKFDKCEWTVTPHTSTLDSKDERKLVMCVDSYNNTFVSDCSDSVSVRPAFVVSSDFEVEVAGSDLSRYSNEELIAEISRRLSKI